jgi:hypothetical protein
MGSRAISAQSSWIEAYTYGARLLGRPHYKRQGTRDNFTAPCKSVVAVAAAPDDLCCVGRGPAQGLPWAKISESRSPTLGLSQAGRSDGCSTAKERDDAAKATTIVKRLTILTMRRRTELNRTGSILQSRFAIACGAALDHLAGGSKAPLTSCSVFFASGSATTTAK